MSLKILNVCFKERMYLGVYMLYSLQKLAHWFFIIGIT